MFVVVDIVSKLLLYRNVEVRTFDTPYGIVVLSLYTSYRVSNVFQSYGTERAFALSISPGIPILVADTERKVSGGTSGMYRIKTASKKIKGNQHWKSGCPAPFCCQPHPVPSYLILSHLIPSRLIPYHPTPSLCVLFLFRTAPPLSCLFFVI